MKIGNQNWLREIEGVNASLKLVKQFGKKGSEDRLGSPKSIAELAGLLKIKLQTRDITKQERQRGKDWLEKKGFDIQSFINRIRQERQGSQRTVQSKYQKSYFYLQELRLETQQELLKKTVQYSIFNMMAKTGTDRVQKKYGIKKMLGKLNLGDDASLLQGFSVKASNQTKSNRSKQKQEKYIKIVKEGVLSQLNVCDWLLRNFYQQIKSRIWDILFRQVEGLQNNRDLYDSKMHLLINSLSLVEQQFSQSLPLQTEALDYYLNSHYLSRLDSNSYIKNNQYGSFWGKCFLYYRAGRKIQFFNLLAKQENRELLNLFSYSDNSIKKRQPSKCRYHTSDSSGKDIFFDQLIFAINGQSKYASQVLSNPTSLDFVWILLRNIGVFYQSDHQKFQQIRSNVVENYQKNQAISNFIFFIMYLLDYDTIIKMGQNQTIDRDDYVHILMILYIYPSLTDSRPLLEQKYIQNLVAYISELVSQKKDQYHYYMAFLPPDKMVSEISGIIVSTQSLESTDWVLLKSFINIRIFQDTVRLTLTKYVNQYGNYLPVAQLWVKLLQDKENALNFILQMLINNSLKKRLFDASQIVRAQILAQKWCLSDNIGKNYEVVFFLFKKMRQLGSLIAQRDGQGLRNFIQKTDLIVIQGRVDFNKAKMFQILIRFQGFEVYFQFLKNISIGSQIYYSKNGQLQKLRDFKGTLLKAVKDLIGLQPYQNYEYLPEVSSLIQSLNDSLYQIKREQGY